MKIIAYTHEKKYPANWNVAWVKVRLAAARVPTTILALLDSGAAVSILNHKYAKHAGIANVTSGEKIEFITATRQKVTAYIHPISLEFMGKAMTVDVAFAPGVQTADVLGMRSFFEQLVVSFDHSERRVDVAFK